MTRHTILLAGSLAALIGSATTSASASVARAVSFEQKVHEADSIVMGTCLSTRSEYATGQHLIVTYSRFRVEKALKGIATGEVVVATPGGEVNGMHQDTIGVPHFQAGDEKVLFVRNSQMGPTVLYFDQGNFDVSREGSEPVITPVPTALVLVDTQSGKAVQPDSTPSTLREFEGRVQKAMSSPVPVSSEFGMVKSGQQKPGSTAEALQTFARENKLLLAAVAFGLAIAAIQFLRNR